MPDSRIQDQAAVLTDVEFQPGTTAGGLRIVAVFEAAKGVLVLLAGFGVLSLIHRDVQRLAEDLVSHLHLNPVIGMYQKRNQSLHQALDGQRMTRPVAPFGTGE